jgi:hypothetical protein
VFSTDPAIGPFALDPLSPVIARGGPGALDELGATAPSVFTDSLGTHAIYLGIDSDGGTHLLAADEVDNGEEPDGGPDESDAGLVTIWQKEQNPIVDTTTPVGRPAAIELSGTLQVFYDAPTASGPQIVSTISGGATLNGASGPCAIQVGGAIQVYALQAADQAIHQYSSPDGVQPFVDNGVALAASGESGTFDEEAVSAPTVITETSALGRTLYRMWYTGTDEDGGTVSIGLAGSFTGLAFERYAENPVRFHGDVASVFLAGDAGYQMLYSQTPFSAPSDISLATGPQSPF